MSQATITNNTRIAMNIIVTADSESRIFGHKQSLADVIGFFAKFRYGGAIPRFDFNMKVETREDGQVDVKKLYEDMTQQVLPETIPEAVQVEREPDVKELLDALRTVFCIASAKDVSEDNKVIDIGAFVQGTLKKFNEPVIIKEDKDESQKN